MNRWSASIAALLFISLTSCGSPADDLWLRGGLDEAVAAAADRNALVFVELRTDWCSWCRRFESETLTDVDVRRELDSFVAVRLDAEKEGAEAARRFGVESFPTLLFLDPAGKEVERIVGFLPPDRFVAEVRRIKVGDTLHACLQRLDADPADADAIRRAVEGLLDRSDPEGAIARLAHFHEAPGHSHEICRELMFAAGRDLHYRVYLRAAKLWATDDEGWTESLDVPPAPGSARLAALVDDGFSALDPADQGSALRAARFEDAGALLDLVSPEAAAGDELFGLAAFAFRGGHYEPAAELYGRWFTDPGAAKDADALNRAAWQLYLARQSLDIALAMAREAHAADPSPDIADTLARLLYITGDSDGAVELELAAAAADGERAGGYLEVVEAMKAGLELADRPSFETYPRPAPTDPQ
jgi:thioredoxin-related protein